MLDPRQEQEDMGEEEVAWLDDAGRETWEEDHLESVTGEEEQRVLDARGSIIA